MVFNVTSVAEVVGVSLTHSHNAITEKKEWEDVYGEGYEEKVMILFNVRVFIVQYL